jgi:hypothetical protein
MSVNHPVQTFKTGTYAVARRIGGSYSQGRYIPGGIVVNLNVDASIQPANGKQLQVLPEAQRSDVILIAYTAEELLTRGQTNEPDQVTISGETFEVFKVATWTHRGVIHYESYLSRKGRL